MGIEFFGDIIVVSLEHRMDRRLQMLDQMDCHDINFRFFNAIKDDNGVKGLVETMKMLFKECITKGLDNVLILEDDAMFVVENPKEFFAEVIPQLPKPYNCLYLGLNLLSRPIRVAVNILKVQDCYTTHAICYSASGMKECLQYLESEPLMPLDSLYRLFIVPQGLSYCTFPLMVTQRDSYSDIEKKVAPWKQLMEMTFPMMTKNLR